MSSATIVKLHLDFQGARAILIAHQSSILAGDGALERVKLYEAIMDRVRKSQEADQDPKDFACDIDVKTTTLKAWVAGAANGIMRQSGQSNDTHVELLLNAAKALRVSEALRKRVPAFVAGDDVLDLDDEPDFVMDYSGLPPRPGCAQTEVGASCDPETGNSQGAPSQSQDCADETEE